MEIGIILITKPIHGRQNVWNQENIFRMKTTLFLSEFSYPSSSTFVIDIWNCFQNLLSKQLKIHDFLSIESFISENFSAWFLFTEIENKNVGDSFEGFGKYHSSEGLEHRSQKVGDHVHYTGRLENRRKSGRKVAFSCSTCVTGGRECVRH